MLIKDGSKEEVRIDIHLSFKHIPSNHFIIFLRIRLSRNQGCKGCTYAYTLCSKGSDCFIPSWRTQVCMYPFTAYVAYI